MPTVKLAARIVAEILAAALIVFVCWEVYYWHNVLLWVDSIRIQQALQEAAKRPPTAPEPPKPAPSQ